jgi:hypothetical protein
VFEDYDVSRGKRLALDLNRKYDYKSLIRYIELSYCYIEKKSVRVEEDHSYISLLFATSKILVSYRRFWNTDCAN